MTPQDRPIGSGADLASRCLGGSVIAASDESFGDKENLLTPGAAAFDPGHYGNRGEIVDGWETRRRREAGHDWALVRLGAPGIVTSVDVDTSFFTGNYPERCAVEACGCEGYPGPAELRDPATEWVQIVPASPLRGDAHNTFAVSDPRRFTHVRLSVFPDGGVARLRVPGLVVPDPRGLERLTIDLVSQQYGGAVVASSDDFYTAACVLNRPDRARSMGEGWETRRRREPGNDFVVFRLAFAGVVRRLIVDTAHFKYNASAEIAVYGRGEDPARSAGSGGPIQPAGSAGSAGPTQPAGSAGSAGPTQPAGSPGSVRSPGSARSARLAESAGWVPVLGRTRLQPDTRHVFAVNCEQPVASVRVDAFPDGGLSRVRVIGSIDPAARRRAGYRWFNALPAGQARQCLADAGITAELAADVTGQRPLPDQWIDGLRGPEGSAQLKAAAFRGALATLLEGQPERSRE